MSGRGRPFSRGRRARDLHALSLTLSLSLSLTPLLRSDEEADERQGRPQADRRQQRGLRDQVRTEPTAPGDRDHGE